MVVGLRCDAGCAPVGARPDRGACRLLQVPAADGPVSFEKHIKPLFRERDRASMHFAFDLYRARSAREHADAILQRLERRRAGVRSVLGVRQGG